MFRLSRANLEWLWAELSLAIRQEHSVADALAKLSGRAFEGKRARVAGLLAAAVGAGRTVSQAVAEQGRLFPPGTAEMLAAGERSGRLPEVMDSLAQDARMEDTLRYNITYAIIYPCVLAVLAMALLYFLRTFVFSQFMRMFEELGDIQLPGMTLAMPMIAQVEIIVLLVVPAAVLLLLYAVPFTLPVVCDGVRLKVPFVGKLVRRMLLARWCRMAGLLFAAGVPEPEAVRILGRASGNRVVRKMAGKMAEELAAGVSMDNAMSVHPFFPPVLTWSVGVAAAGGGHARIWPVAEELYRRQARRSSVVAGTVLRILFPLIAYQTIGMALVAQFLPMIRIFHSIG